MIFDDENVCHERVGLLPTELEVVFRSRSFRSARTITSGAHGFTSTWVIPAC
jgi:hypothetical protein